MRLRGLAYLSLISLLLFLLPTNVGASANQDVDLRFSTLDELNLRKVLRLDGDDAGWVQHFIDDGLGDGDNDIEEWELDRYDDYVQAHVVGSSATEHVLDGLTGRIVAMDVSFSGILGRYAFDPDRDASFDSSFDDDDEFTMIVEQTIALPTDALDGSTTVTYYYTNTSDVGRLDFEAPPGFSVSRTSGVTQVSFPSEVRRSFTGSFSDAAAAQARMRLAAEADTFLSLAELMGPDAKLPSTSTVLEFGHELRTARFATNYEVTGLDAVGLKALIDQLGDADGEVDAEERNRAIDRVEQSHIGHPSRIYFANGEGGRISSLHIQAQGLEGDVSAPNRVTMSVSGLLDFPIPTDVDDLVLTIGRSASNAEATVTLPDGFQFDADNAEGLTGAVFANGDEEVRGTESGDGVRLLVDRESHVLGYSAQEWVPLVIGGVIALLILFFLIVEARRVGALSDRTQISGEAPGSGAAGRSRRSQRQAGRRAEAHAADATAPEWRESDDPNIQPAEPSGVVGASAGRQPGTRGAHEALLTDVRGGRMRTEPPGHTHPHRDPHAIRAERPHANESTQSHGPPRLRRRP